jgi:hypothetical protein
MRTSRSSVGEIAAPLSRPDAAIAVANLLP